MGATITVSSYTALLDITNEISFHFISSSLIETHYCQCGTVHFWSFLTVSINFYSQVYVLWPLMSNLHKNWRLEHPVMNSFFLFHDRSLVCDYKILCFVSILSYLFIPTFYFLSVHYSHPFSLHMNTHHFLPLTVGQEDIGC